VTLKLLAAQEWVAQPFVTRSIARYEELTGNRIELQVVPDYSADSIIRKKFAVNVLPDLVMYYGGAQFDALQPVKNFADLSQEDWVKNLDVDVRGQLTNNFSVYGFPLWKDTVSGMIYNKEIFRELQLKVPTNLVEFYNVCEQLKLAGITPIYMGFRDIRPLFTQYGISAILAQKENSVVQLNRNQLTLSSMPEFVQWLEWYKTI